MIRELCSKIYAIDNKFTVCQILDAICVEARSLEAERDRLQGNIAVLQTQRGVHMSTIAELEATVLEHENQTACIPEDMSIVEYVSHLETERATFRKRISELEYEKRCFLKDDAKAFHELRELEGTIRQYKSEYRGRRQGLINSHAQLMHAISPAPVTVEKSFENAFQTGVVDFLKSPTHCGHDRKHFLVAEDGTAYCAECEREREAKQAKRSEQCAGTDEASRKKVDDEA